MSEELSQEEADDLLSMQKKRADDETRRFPGPGERITALLTSMDGREDFLLDVNRRSINLSRIAYQTRCRAIVVLARLDLGGAPHRNPDDSEIGVPHLHLYRKGFADKWAFDVPAGKFRDLSDRWSTYEDFMAFCQVVVPPLVTRDLVS